MGATVSGRGCVLAGDQYSECSPDRSHLNPLMRTSTPQHAPGRRCRRGHHRAHVRNERPTRMLSGQRAHEGAQATTYRANVRISGPRCPISGSWANFVEWRLGRNRAGRVLSRHQSRAPTAGRPSARIEQETDLPGPPQGLIGQVVLVFGLSFVATKPKGGGWTRCDLSSWLARSCWFYPGF